MSNESEELDRFLNARPETAHLDVLVIDLCGNAAMRSASACR